MKLQQLFSYFDAKSISVEELADSNEPEVSGIFFNARQVISGSVFVAIKGFKSDGHEFLTQAVENGAAALVVENKSNIPASFTGKVLEVVDSRVALDQLAAIFYGFPSEQLFCFGVTGTNGKTSITYFLEHILNFHHKSCGVMGTVNHRVGNEVWTSDMTTPDPLTLQHRLRQFVDAGAIAVAMEVSSHALDQKRAASVHFNTVIFTNLTLDHLDYHQSMDNYFGAKQRLFTEMLWETNKKPTFAVVNMDDSYGRKLKVADTAVTWTFGQRESDFQYKILKMNFSETEFELKTPMEQYTVKVPFSGNHMISNCVASMVAAISAGVSLDQSIHALTSFYGVPGRLQKVMTASLKTVFVDYAHTPDALENVLKSLHEVRSQSRKKSKVITVFGCGGDRDKIKRPLMAKIATELSDFVFVTSDNPRTEDPMTIIADIQRGIEDDFKKFLIEPDREKAIAAAIRLATIDDVVLIAGKGHEDYQIIGTEKIHFSDVEVAQKYLKDQV
ncbi:MAG: UDP-N-acetylmuramoyl-L-alanyl-D-glutamate--2,6-diaminopimelate ligase [Bdellovibrionales bacterium RIFCSPHIGHO2_01_FULL_40_29]|nr:MAG: UDP-N-acetylmuramoyl-L-alanyl-D-glutamate--2,6-diaminopimelate ligase [Bdellovibrionales bacterium RIFCSPHIGHO2_01_FULL_40_29]OFZ34018.1 MAG: UDP-N-acetylmuramoyl-L-alanyl-D-glutamate--2,6-diaminopimelate ligase [Bdellovibrionales bacterium RIFCSPHIGHO2_02_FULL_40_15]